MTALSFFPVTTENQTDFDALFNAPGGPKHCWCMVWRGSPAEKKEKGGPAKHAQIARRIAAGTPIGLLAYGNDLPCAWVSIAPRNTHFKLGGPEEDASENIWSLTCMYVPRKRRAQGLAHQLIAAAINHARQQGATLLEAYPVKPESPSFKYMGTIPAFEAAGFAYVQPAGTRRHVMRLQLA